MNISDYTIAKHSFVFYPYYELTKKEGTDISKSLINENEELNFRFNFTILNPRAVIPLFINYYRWKKLN